MTIAAHKPMPDPSGAVSGNGAGNVGTDNSQQTVRLARIAEIIELMEETKKNRDWLLDQIKQKRQKVAAKPGMGPVGILKMCTDEFLANVLGYLQKDEFRDVEVVVPPITKSYHWFFTDIVAASDPTKTTADQARKIILLNKLIEMTDTFKQRDPETTLVLPTGDGMAMGFDDSAEKPLNLALEVHKGLAKYNSTRKKEDRVELRIGLDSGPVFIIKDLNGNENVWGPGIIMARRVMDLADRMNILASARFANDVRMLRPEYKNIMHLIGDYQIKHGDKILIYNVYGDGFGNQKAPSKDKTQKSAAAEEVRKTSSRFIFNNIEVALDVLDPKTMATHHTMIWDMVNITTEPIERIFCYLDGDVPKKFQELNVTIKDEEDRDLEIMSLNVDKPYHKEFFVKARRPLKPAERGRFVKIEYDWDEPERQFEYFFAADCKKFNYSLTAHKDIDVKQKVVKVEKDTGEKFLAPTPAAVKYLPDRTVVTWSAANLRAFESYRFDW